MIAPQIASYDGRVNVIDVGSGTIDILQVINKKPVLSKCISLPVGILTCIDDIQKYFRMQYNMELDDYSSRRCCSFGPEISRRSLQRPRRSLSVNIQKRCLLNWSRRGST